MQKECLDKVLEPEKMVCLHREGQVHNHYWRTRSRDYLTPSQAFSHADNRAQCVLSRRGSI